MEFLVQGLQQLPPLMPEEEVRRLRRAEGARAQELIDAGALRRIWRVPGQTGSWTLWRVPDADVLDAHLRSLPLYPWYDLHAMPLARDEVDPSISNPNDSHHYAMEQTCVESALPSS